MISANTARDTFTIYWNEEPMDSTGLSKKGQKMVIWCVAAPPFGKLDGKIFSPLASVRLRCLEIIPDLVSLGHTLRLVPADKLGQHMGLHSELCDLCIVFKVFDDISDELQNLRASGVRIIVDCTEHIFDNLRSGKTSQELFTFADLITVSSEGLATLVKSFADKPVIVIHDCVEGEPGVSNKPLQEKELNLLWFGRSVNLDALYDFLLRSTADSTIPKSTLRIMTDLQNAAPAPTANAAIRIEWLDWSPVALRNQLAWAHAAIFPTTKESLDQVKSANRVRQTLWNRRLPVAEFRKELRDLQDFGLFGDCLEALLPRIRPEWSDLRPRIDRGWRVIEEKFTPHALARCWHDTATMVIQQRQ